MWDFTAWLTRLLNSFRERGKPAIRKAILENTGGGALIRSWGARKGTADLAGQPGHPQFRNSCSRDNRPRGSTKPASSVAVRETSPSVPAHTLQVAQKKLSGPSISLSQNEAIKYHRALLLQVWSMDQQHQQHLGLVRDADSRPPRQILNQNFCGRGAQGICLNNPLDNSDACWSLKTAMIKQVNMWWSRRYFSWVLELGIPKFHWSETWSGKGFSLMLCFWYCSGNRILTSREGCSRGPIAGDRQSLLSSVKQSSRTEKEFSGAKSYIRFH